MGNPWKNATSVADLGNAMALWLSGSLRRTPTYCGSTTEEETRHLLPTLIACNRAGFVTVCSQPGQAPERGYDGRMWRQRATVEGWIADEALLGRIRGAARSAGLTMIAHGPGSRGGEWTSLTEADGEIQMAAGDYPGHRSMIASEWQGIGRHATQELRTSTHLDLIDPVWGRDTVLWPALARAIR